ncbi:MAG: protein kinase domain-containing protein [Colwellia sp.]
MNLDLNHQAKSKTSVLNISLGGYSSAGHKKENQDAFASLIPPKAELSTKGAVAVIADGVSSANRAEEAAQIAVTQFISDYYATPETWSTQKSASKVLSGLNQWLNGQPDVESGYTLQWLTTFSAVVIKSSTAYIFHVGDTRISLYRDNSLEAVTTEHQQKTNGNNSVLTRALGADMLLKVDVQEVAIQPGDIFVLTCDGVHDFINPTSFKSILNDIPEVSETLQSNNKILENTSQQITDIALKNGSQDNVSCLLLKVNSTPSSALVEIERELQHKAILPVLSIGNKVDDYEICKVIHSSVRSHLYLAKHPQQKEPCVLKTPSENFSQDSGYLQGFSREAWLGERLNTPHVMKIRKGHEKSQFLYHVCDYIDGQTLTQWMRDNPKPTLAEVREIIDQVILALRAFQRLDVVHRDLKPDNIMIDKHGKVFLIDYGTALIASFAENTSAIKETHPQGTLNYIAPETLLTLHADHLSDLFSLGVIAYEMLCGELPYKPMQLSAFHGQQYDNKISYTERSKYYAQWQYRSINYYRKDLPVWLDMVLSQATNADPISRFQAYSEFSTQLTQPKESALIEYNSQPLLKKNPVLFWKSVAALFCLLWLLK